MEKQNDFFEEYVSINNLEHYFLHYPTESDFLVLFLHGGPGQTESYLAYKTVSKNRNYTIVFYDQRGSGKTNLKDASQEKVTLKILISDLDKIIDYLKSKYHQKKIIILGHSWGSILGLEYSKLFPEKISAYVGMGQVINFRQGENVGFEYCYKLANQKDKKKLLKLGNYPESVTKENALAKCNKFRVIQMKYGICGYKEGTFSMLKISLKSPVFSWKDLKGNIAASKRNTLLMDYLIDYDTSDFLQPPFPVYFISGENDWQVPYVCVKEYFDKITAPDKKFFLLKNAGHLTDLENPQDYNNALNEICERILKG